MAFELPALPYAYDALEPHIDARTVEIHYTKHHATYLKNFNAALEKHPELNGMSTVELLGNLDKVPEDIRTMVRSNGGGYYNHNLYWENMAPTQADIPMEMWSKSLIACSGIWRHSKLKWKKRVWGV
jgi:superoxide dismutase, Fe-Mn family